MPGPEQARDVGDDQLYRRRARYYDAIYHWKDYASESSRVRELLASEGIADGSRVLEAACGTAAHMMHLRQWYDIRGFDLSEPMIQIAREKLPDMPLFVADMASFHVEAQFDALLCLFSSIGYVYPEDRLRSAAACMARAIRPGGVLVIEPWIAPESYIPGRAWMQTFDGAELKLCRMVISRREGDMATMEFHWLAAATGGEVEHFIDRHALWLCPHDLLIRIFSDAGFDCRLDSSGLTKDRELLIGRRR